MTESASQNAQPAAPAAFDQWAIIELFGHARIAGRAREEMLAGKPFLRVDVPATPGADAFTRYYGGGAVYSLTPTTEEIASLAAAQLHAAPITVYIPSARQLGPGGPIADGFDPDDPDFDFDEDGE